MADEDRAYDDGEFVHINGMKFPSEYLQSEILWHDILDRAKFLIQQAMAQYGDGGGRMTQSGGAPTSYEAAQGRSSTTRRLRARVLGVLMVAGPGSFEQIVSVAALLTGTDDRLVHVPERITELQALGLVETTGGKRPNRSGDNALIWSIRPVKVEDPVEKAKYDRKRFKKRADIIRNSLLQTESFEEAMASIALIHHSRYPTLTEEQGKQFKKNTQWARVELRRKLIEAGTEIPEWLTIDWEIGGGGDDEDEGYGEDLA
jgi:hypothetical protein